MKGKLYKKEQPEGWYVVYDIDGFTKAELPLHPDNAKICNNYGDYSMDWDCKEVEFDWCVIIDHDSGKGIQYAKLKDAETSCEYSGLSDEEIEKAVKNPMHDAYDFREGAKWYREQIKLKQPYVSDDFQIGPDGAYEHTEDWNTLPTEKAKELVDKFSNECLLTTDGGKVAALIMVDGIKKILYDQDSMIRYDYWFEVKQEIEKL